MSHLVVVISSSPLSTFLHPRKTACVRLPVTRKYSRKEMAKKKSKAQIKRMMQCAEARGKVYEPPITDVTESMTSDGDDKLDFQGAD
eukprot:scaffold40622_cov67-Attheya_sp.AAC.1